MGTTYLAVDKVLRRKVALKVDRGAGGSGQSRGTSRTRTLLT